MGLNIRKKGKKILQLKGHKIIIKQINKIMSVTREFKIFIIQNSICKTCVNVMWFLQSVIQLIIQMTN